MLQDVSDLFAVKASEKNLWIGTDIGPVFRDQLIGDGRTFAKSSISCRVMP